MKKTILLICALLAFSALAYVPAWGQKPYLGTLNGVSRLYYKGEPVLLLSGELHNSTAAGEDYLRRAMASSKAMGLNSLIVTAEWDLIEPEQGKYDFSSIDRIITLSEENDLPVVIAWFGTWKNGVSSYIPGWMKRDTKKYFRAQDEKGQNTDYISAFCEDAMKADAKAFSALMKYIKGRDRNNMVLFMQVENETGLWQQSIDNSKPAQKAYSGNVPAELVSLLQSGKVASDNPMMLRWAENGRKSKGSWKEVFGDNAYAEAFFMQWAYASYIEKVASAGKAEYDIPMYVNTVAMPSGGFSFNAQAGVPTTQGGQAQGQQQAPPAGGNPFGSMSPLFPSGAPIWQAIDMYHLFCPSIDFLSPDIYVPAFKNVSDSYTRVDNPLFIPETGRNAAPAYYALATNNAIGFSAFAIEDAYLIKEYRGVYSTLSELLPLISQYQGTGLMKGFLREGNEEGTSFEIGNYTVEVKYVKEEKSSYGLVIKTGDEDFVVSGVGAIVNIILKDSGKVTRYEFVEEGYFSDGKWVSEVRLNGDQTSHGQDLYLRGRVEYQDGYVPSEGEVMPRRNVASSEAHQKIVTDRVKSPSIYCTRVYSYNK
ncbi:MAG: DUF5597 domain-containing protein [Bacteroidales bacterium]|nr:DUF5597 domain-containing protein [Bacteroidales bacterium]